MRINASHPLSGRVSIYLDGDLVSQVTMADDEEGVIERYCGPPMRITLGEMGYCVEREELRGRVEIRVEQPPARDGAAR